MAAERVETGACPVNSYNSWDPLEEIIVGRLEGATIPPAHPSVTFNIPSSAAQFLRFFGGRRYPRFLLRAAQAQLDRFIGILEAEGVTVRRPALFDFHRRYCTPYWSSRGFSAAVPRDGLMVFGNEIIEAPMAWRSRFFESYPYHALFREYEAAGARWTAAPRPLLRDELYDYRYTIPKPGEPMRYVTTEAEPVFDTADFIRCGRDLFVQRSNVTNLAGIAWLRRHLADRCRVHLVETRSRAPMHIDSTFMPLAPGKLLINPDYMDVKKIPALFRGWDVIVAPRPDPVPGLVNKFAAMASAWISLNVLMLDEQRVIVDESQPTMIKTLKEHGFQPIPCAFTRYVPFGGSFHCATLDIRRRGELRSYF